MPSSGRLIGTLGLISMMSGLLVVFTYQATFDRIAENKRVALEKAIFSVLPGAVTRVSFALDESGITELTAESKETPNLFAGYDDNGALVGLAMEGAARGYQDVVRILYGYDPNRECVIGITVLQSTETPGLGDRVETDPDFLANFDCLEAKLTPDKSAMANEIVTVKHGTKTEPWQVDAISGATITSKAIGAGLGESTSRMLPLVGTYWEQGSGFKVQGSEEGGGP